MKKLVDEIQKIPGAVLGLKNMVIGLTGTIGSGKSLVASMLEELGAIIVDTDEIAREVVRPESPGWRLVLANWGECVLAPDRTLDRKKLADIVFKKESERKKLNAILHPLIAAETTKRIALAPPGKVVVLAVPLLFESGFDKLAAQNWLVTADEYRLVERIMARDGCTREHALDRMRSQMPQEEKERRADVIIRNNGTVKETHRQVAEAWDSLKKSARHSK